MFTYITCSYQKSKCATSSQVHKCTTKFLNKVHNKLITTIVKGEEARGLMLQTTLPLDSAQAVVPVTLQSVKPATLPLDSAQAVVPATLQSVKPATLQFDSMPRPIDAEKNEKDTVNKKFRQNLPCTERFPNPARKQTAR